MKNRYHRSTRILFALLFLLSGTTLALLVADKTGTLAIFAHSLGLGLVVTGCLAVFQELIASPSVIDELRRQIDRLVGVLEKPGLRVVAAKRRGEPRYYKWVLENEPQDAFFAGHSVLHRVEEDFSSRGLLPIKDALRRKVSEGSNVRILFLDPTWEVLDNLAIAGGQEARLLRRDLAKTLEICKQICVSLSDQRLQGTVEIRTCSEIVQYAFHYVVCRRRHTDEMLVGFYFADRPGTETPVLETDDEEIRRCFNTHFTTVFDRAKRLLSYSHGSLEFDHSYFEECIEALEEKLGKGAVERLRT